MNFENKCIFVIWSEDLWIPDDILNLADQIVTIPQIGNTASLNVWVATSILFYKFFESKYKDKIKINRFHPFKLSPGKLAKKVIQLETTQLLVNNPRKDTPITITLKAYAKEDPEKISVIRKAVFIFPRSDKLNMK